MTPRIERQLWLEEHVAALRRCRRCPRMLPPPISGGAVMSRVILVGQAPGVKEPVLGRPFAWTAGRTLFGWFQQNCGMDEGEIRACIYFAAVCRCFPGRNTNGGDRVPAPDEIRNCAAWINNEFAILRPRLVIAVGKLAISQFIVINKLDEVIGRAFRLRRERRAFDMIPLPHPSGASPWHRISPGKELLRKAMQLIDQHPAMTALKPTRSAP